MSVSTDVAAAREIENGEIIHLRDRMESGRRKTASLQAQVRNLIQETMEGKIVTAWKCRCWCSLGRKGSWL